MKTYIMVDFEGIAGFLEWDDYADTTAAGVEKRSRLRTFLTREVNAAVEGAMEGGAKDVVVWDSHGPANNCNNIYIEKLHPEVQVIQGWKGLPNFYPDLDDSFAAGMYIGMHAMEGTPHAVVPHTRQMLNGHALGEGGMFLAMCSFFRVPVVFVSGDDAAIRQVLEQVPAMEHVETKWSYGPYSARTRTPAKSCELIRAGARRGMERRSEIPCWDVQPPYELKGEDAPELKGDNLFELYKEFLGCTWSDQSLDPQLGMHREKRKSMILRYNG